MSALTDAAKATVGAIVGDLVGILLKHPDPVGAAERLTFYAVADSEKALADAALKRDLG